MDDWYCILGVKSDASLDAIKTAFRSIAQKYHPDRAQENPEFAEMMFRKASDAYRVLGNPQKRQEYDRARAQEIVTDRLVIATDLWRRYILSNLELSEQI